MTVHLLSDGKDSTDCYLNVMSVRDNHSIKIKTFRKQRTSSRTKINVVSRCPCMKTFISEHLSYCLRRTNLRGLWLEILRLLSIVFLLPENPSQNPVCSFQGSIPVSFEVYFLLSLVKHARLGEQISL